MKPANGWRLSFWCKWMESDMIHAINCSSLEPLTYLGISTLPSGDVSNEESIFRSLNLRPDTASSKNSAKRHRIRLMTINSETLPNVPKGKSPTMQLFRVWHKHSSEGCSLWAIAHKSKSQEIQKDEERERTRSMAASASFRKHPRSHLLLRKVDWSRRETRPTWPRIRISPPI